MECDPDGAGKYQVVSVVVTGLLRNLKYPEVILGGVTAVNGVNGVNS